jgi:hypothetical protein
VELRAQDEKLARIIAEEYEMQFRKTVGTNMDMHTIVNALFHYGDQL